MVVTGLEPVVFPLSGERFIQLSYTTIIFSKLAGLTGIEPANVGSTNRCVNHFTTFAITATGVAGVEPTSTVLETVVLPLNYTPSMEGEGFEPSNPKERIYSPLRLATSLSLHK